MRQRYAQAMSAIDRHAVAALTVDGNIRPGTVYVGFVCHVCDAFVPAFEAEQTAEIVAGAGAARFDVVCPNPDCISHGHSDCYDPSEFVTRAATGGHA